MSRRRIGRLCAKVGNLSIVCISRRRLVPVLLSERAQRSGSDVRLRMAKLRTEDRGLRGDEAESWVCVDEVGAVTSLVIADRACTDDSE